MSVVVAVVLNFLLMWDFVNTACVMYGQCHHDSANEKYKNCYYEDPKEPEALNKTAKNYEEALAELKNYCAYLFYDEEGNEKDPEDVKVCCDVEQIFTMVEGFTMAAPFARCPTCYTNFLNNMCAFTCSPEQHKFATATEVYPNGNIVDWPYVNATDIKIDSDYLSSIYDSCKDVSSPSTGGLLLEAVCGEYGATYCTPERWFGYLGNPIENPLTPMTINYVVTQNDSNAMNMTTLGCNQAYQGSQSCSCVDCPLSCISKEFEALEEGFTIIVFNGFAFIAAVLFFCFGLCTTLFIFLKYRNSVHAKDESHQGILCSFKTHKVFKTPWAKVFWRWQHRCPKAHIEYFKVLLVLALGVLHTFYVFHMFTANMSIPQAFLFNDSSKALFGTF